MYFLCLSLLCHCLLFYVRCLLATFKMFYFSQRTLLFFVKNVSFFDLAFYLLIGSDLSSFTLPFFLLQIVFLHYEI